MEFKTHNLQTALQMGRTEDPSASTSINPDSFRKANSAYSRDLGSPKKVDIDTLTSNCFLGGATSISRRRSLVDLEEQRFEKTVDSAISMSEHWQCFKLPQAEISQHAAERGSAGPGLQAAAYGRPSQHRPLVPTISAPPGIFFVRPASQQSNAFNPRIDGKRRAPNRRALHQGLAAHAGQDVATFAAAKSKKERLGRMLATMRSSGEACDLSLADKWPHILDLAFDKDGVQFLLLQCSKSEQTVSELCEVVVPEACKISTDEFGKELMLGLLELAPFEQQWSLSAHLGGSMKQLSCDAHGCRVVQKAFEVMPSELGIVLLEGLKDCIDSCIKNIHGNHVIQMCIVQMPPESVNFVAKAVIDWGEHKAAVHQYGCRVVMRLLEYCEMQPTVVKLRESLMNNVQALSQDRYGNYAVQRLLENGSRADKQRIITEIIEGDVLKFATHKYAHNVVLKCARISQDAVVKALVSSPIDDLVSQRFGAAVVERMLELCTSSNRQLLKRHIMDTTLTVKENEHAASLLAKMDTILEFRM